ncbi:hypothetical protein JMUB5056_1690 [Leptotrichia hongkongensis]|uniref:DUF4376 domain-containing protein n=1 Tax=Leptotrichia hongkongensis TaxID=554406 RepID=A0A510L8J1_9FUSO|nr:hypothetical protein [Leptotrichia hongkongensis]BBM60096.1 hypothetical protein JMUB5056_1690 [Leptotrichia hongkongensis]
MTVIYIYLIATMECIARPTVTTAEEFKKNPSLFYPDWNEETMKSSTSLLSNPVIDSKTGELREMSEIEKLKSGKTTLSDGSYLDEVNETIVTIAKPNEWSVWDKNSHAWKVDNDLLNAKLKELREKALKNLAEAKSNFLNQPLEIEKNSKKYTFENNEKNRNSLSLKMSLMWTLEQDKIEKVKVLNDKGLVEFIELNRVELKVLAKKIQDILEIADMAEQMAVVGISRYNIEQMLELNVSDFFQN